MIMRNDDDNREERIKDSTFRYTPKPVSGLVEVFFSHFYTSHWKWNGGKNLFFHFDYSNNLHKQSTKLNDFYWEWAGRVEKDDKIAIEKHFSDRAKFFSPHSLFDSIQLNCAIMTSFRFNATRTFPFRLAFFSSLSRSHQRHSQVYCDYNLHRVELCFFGQQWMEEEKEEAIRAWLYFCRRLTFEKKNHRAAMFVLQADNVVKMNMLEKFRGHFDNEITRLSIQFSKLSI